MKKKAQSVCPHLATNFKYLVKQLTLIVRNLNRVQINNNHDKINDLRNSPLRLIQVQYFLCEKILVKCSAHHPSQRMPCMTQ